jgi:hypothetical protein
MGARRGQAVSVAVMRLPSGSGSADWNFTGQFSKSTLLLPVPGDELNPTREMYSTGRELHPLKSGACHDVF